MESTRQNSEFMTLPEVAAFLSISKTSVYRLTQRRELTHYRIGSQLRYKRDDVEQYLDKNRVAATRLPE